MRKRVYPGFRLRPDVPLRRVRGALLVALLVTVLSPGAAEQDIQLTIERLDWVYGPESWKLDGPPGPEVVAGAYAGWQASLGLRLEVELDLRLPATPAAKVIRANLTDGMTVIVGQQMPSQATLFFFDVDGQRALPQVGAVAPLAPRPWTLHVVAEESAGPLGGPFPLGEDSELILPLGMRLAGALMQGEPVAAIRVPEEQLPRFRDVVAGPDVWMPAQTLRPSDAMVMRVETGLPGVPLEVTAWAARSDGVRAPEVPDVPGAPTPADGLLPDAAAATTRLVSAPLGTTVSDHKGMARIGVNVSQLADAFGVDQDLVVIAARAQDGSSGGALAFVVGFALDAPVVRGFEAPEPGGLGSLGVGVDVSANGTGAALGELLALTTDAHGGTADAAATGGRLLARAPLGFLPDGTGRAYLDARPLRASAETGYRALAFLQTPAGDYAGHATAVRGLEPRLVVPRLGAGHDAVFRLDLSNRFSDGRPGVADGHAVAASLDFRFDGVEHGQRMAAVPEGGTLATNWLVTPATAGVAEAVVSVDTGDLLFEHRRSLNVLTAEAFEKEEQPWYDPNRLVPAPGVALVAFTLVVALAGARRREPPSRNG